MRVRFNALHACFELVPESTQADTNIIKNCDASVAVGDIVYESTIADNTVVTTVDNTNLAPAIGVVVAKPTATTATVQTYGEYSGASGLQRGEKVFLSTSGNFTSTPPNTDYVQTLGFALSPTSVFINPNYVRVKRV